MNKFSFKSPTDHADWVIAIIAGLAFLGLIMLMTSCNRPEEYVNNRMLLYKTGYKQGINAAKSSNVDSTFRADSTEMRKLLQEGL